jgi:hypothetical protein
VAGAEDCVVTSYFMDSRQFLYLRFREGDWNWTTGRGEIEGKGRNTLGISRPSTRPEWRSIDCP